MALRDRIRSALAVLAMGCASTLVATATHAAPPDSAHGTPAAPAQPAPTPPKPTMPTKSDLVQPEDVAKSLALPEARRPMLVHVGFPTLYKSAHIAGSVYAGPCRNQSGRDDLTRLLQSVPKDRAIVLYCGCCPWEHCPNVIPAFRIARSLGLKNAKILYISQNMQHDWVDRGLPALVH
jgi:thiosulfate/3-mercaptopyruvate sulfurtransferase